MSTSKYQVLLYESKRRNVISNRIIVGLFIFIILEIFVIIYLSKEIKIKLDPSMTESRVVGRGFISEAYVYSFVERTISKLYDWKKDGLEDYNLNIKKLSKYLTPQCKAFLYSDSKSRKGSGELTNRVRRLNPAQITEISRLVKYEKPSRWYVRSSYDLFESINGISIKEGRYYWDVPVISDYSNSDNEFDLLIDCPFLNNTPKKIKQGE